ncbi:hydrophobic surface binding protein [Mycena pura]|uniref:Hydrophobic surface binding protein n=1 Tax=Mycena pura TaxID=153505 RepID=A0AAD6Y7G2_9AGAR|nr:hydrophobic surface binding protein [Mycena pura]
MVQHSLQLLFLSLFAGSLVSLFSVGSGEPVKRTVATVEADIATIATQVESLDSTIDAIDALGVLSLTSALGVHSATLVLATTVDSATNDVKAAGVANETDGNTILNSIQAIVPNIEDALTKMSSAKAVAAIAALPGFTAMALSDLKTLNDSATAFADALIAASPADLVSTGMSIKTTVVSAIASTIAVYS